MSGPGSIEAPDACRVGEALAWLSAFYAKHCEGDWEHQYGATIETIDNPGWLITVDLVGTLLSEAEFEEVRYDDARSGDWYMVSNRDGKLSAAGSPDRLGTLLCLAVDAMRSVEGKHEA